MSEVQIALPKMYQWQLEAINTPFRHRLIVVSRRAGKTSAAKTDAVRALLNGKKVLWVAPIHQQVIEIYRSIEQTLSNLLTYRAANKELRTVTNGQIWFRSSDNPDSLRSLGYDLVIFDEMAFASEDSWKVIRPTLAERKGRFLGITSPNGHNWFYHLYNRSTKLPDWYCIQRDWTCAPHLTQEEMDKAKAEMTSSEFRQEFMATFEQPSGAIFEPEGLRDILIPIEQWPEHFQRSMIAVDVSLGKDLKSDFQSIIFVGWMNNMAYIDCYAERMPIQPLNKKIKDIWTQYKAEGIAFETNGFQQLVQDDFCRLFTVPPPIYQVNNTVNKETRISRLSTWLSKRQIRILDTKGGRTLHEQLSDFPMGDHDDCPDALEMAMRTLAETTRS